MSEQVAETPTEAEPKPQEGADQQQEAVKTFDAEYVANLRKEAAKYRTEAKANSEAARRLAEIEEANKTEVQKATDRLAAAERERDQARIEGLRFKVAVKHGISEEDADLFLTAGDEESLTRQAARLAEREAQRQEAAAEEAAAKKKQGNYVPREGTPTTASESDAREAARRIFGG